MPANPPPPDRKAAARSTALPLWAAAHVGLGVAATVAETPLFRLGEHTAPVASNAVLVAAGVLAYVGVPGRRYCLVAAVVLAAVSGFGALMDVVTLVFDQAVDDGAAALNHASGAVGVALLGGRLLRSRRPPGTRWPVGRVAAVGVAALVPYVAMKTTWALGGTFAGMSGAEMYAAAQANGASGLSLRLHELGLDPTVLLALAGAVLLVVLASERTRRLPRWLLLAPALVGALTLVPYGTLGLLYVGAATAGVVTLPAGDFPTSADALLVSWVGLGSFLVHGVALAVVALRRLRDPRRGRAGAAVCGPAAATGSARSTSPPRR